MNAKRAFILSAQILPESNSYTISAICLLLVLCFVCSTYIVYLVSNIFFTKLHLTSIETKPLKLHLHESFVKLFSY